MDSQILSILFMMRVVNSQALVTAFKIGFAIDIDGTVTRGGQPLPSSKETLERLIRNRIPFVFLTNNAAQSEAQMAEKLSRMFELKIKAEQVVLSFTPVKHLLSQYDSQGITLIVARQEALKSMLPLQFIKNYITPGEYCKVFPDCLAYLTYQRCQKTVSELKRRLKLEQLTRETMKFSAVLILNPLRKWEESFQIIMDVLSTPEGRVSPGSTYVHHANHIPVISVLNDMFVSTNYHLPRLLIRPFTASLQTIYRLVYGSELKMQIYGKPQKVVYDYTKSHMEKHFGKLNRFVMVGDNVDTDIKGAHEAGWDSIFVRSGVGKGECEMATINSDDILEGIETYAKANGIPF